MLSIILTKGKSTIVDDEDFEWLNQWRWNLHTKGYAYRKENKHNIFLHRVVNRTPAQYQTDHINQNKLDNRRSNLRTVIRSQNQQNTGMFKTNTSGYKGVSWSKIMNKWESYLWSKNKKINLGYFADIQVAVLARQKGEQIHWVK